MISIGSIALLGVEQGLDLKGGSSIQLQLEHPVNDSTMKVVTSVLDKRLNLYGVSDVKVRSSGDQMVIVETELGLLTVKGDSLRINKLSIDTSEVVVEGEIYNLAYSENDLDKKNGSFLNKIFK